MSGFLEHIIKTMWFLSRQTWPYNNKDFLVIIHIYSTNINKYKYEAQKLYLIINNLKFHKCKNIVVGFEAKGYRIKFLPLYYFLNPIKKPFGK